MDGLQCRPRATAERHRSAGLSRAARRRATAGLRARGGRDPGGGVGKRGVGASVLSGGVTRRSLEELIRSERWFHAIDFGSVSSGGRFPAATPPNYTLYGVFELLRAVSVAGHTAIDIGTMDGLTAFVLKTLGARRVIATDLAP